MEAAYLPTSFAADLYRIIQIPTAADQASFNLKAAAMETPCLHPVSYTLDRNVAILLYLMI